MNSQLVLCGNGLQCFRLKAITWTANGLVVPSSLQRNAGDSIAEIVRGHGPQVPLVINCRGVTRIDDHAFDAAADAIRTVKRPTAFICASRDFATEVADYLRAGGASLAPSVPFDRDFAGGAMGFGLERSVLEELVEKIPGLEAERATKIVEGCFCEYGDGRERHDSTPIRANGAFNARRILSRPAHFVWIVTLLAERLEDLIEATKPRNPRLLTVSLRGSPFAAALSHVAVPRLPVDIVDHMGPRTRILEEYSLAATAGCTYYYIGDFTVGGTELKVAQTYAYCKGAGLENAVVIGSWLRPENYLPIRLVPLVHLPDCRTKANFGL